MMQVPAGKEEQNMKWDQTKQYSHQEVEAMQQDALRRVKQMQQRSEQALRHSPKAPSLFEPVEEKPEQEAPPAPDKPVEKPFVPQQEMMPPPCCPPAEPPKPITLQGVLDSLGLDREQLLILGLVVLFASDGADKKLLLALLYLFL